MLTVLRSLYYQLPEGLRQAVIVRIRAVPHWKRAGIIFVHIPKAAGTSISDALYGRSIAHPRACDIEKWLPPRDVQKLDPVFQPQWAFVCDDQGNLMIDHVGRLERLEPTLDFIAQAIGHRLEMPEANRSGDRVDYRSFYTPQLVEVVRRLYSEDIERFGYTFEGLGQ